jgi:cellobiose phosphorylase
VNKSDPLPPLPFGFSPQGEAFVLETTLPPRPWKNAHFSGAAGTWRYWSRFTNTGAGSAFCVDAEGNHLQLIPEHGHKTIYLRDEEDARVWSIAGFPVVSEVRDYRCEYRRESTEFSSSFRDIHASQRGFVPKDATYEIWTLRLENRSDRQREISAVPYVSLQLDGFRSAYEFGSWHKVATVESALNGMWAQNRYPNPKPEWYRAALITDKPLVGATAGDGAVFPSEYSYSHPALVTGKDLPFQDAMHDEDGMSLMLQNRFILAPGAVETVHYVFGHIPTVEAGAEVLALLRRRGWVEEQLAEVAARERALAETSQIETGHARIDRFFNIWLKKQMSSYLAFKSGVRDNLQTDMSFAMADYPASLNNMLAVLSSQFECGNFPHSHSPFNPKIYSDKPTWCLMTVPALIRESGDFSVLELPLPYIRPDGSPTPNTETVQGHLIRAFNYLRQDIGENGLHRHHHADWNDDLDGLSESSLVSMLFCKGLLDCADLWAAAGQTSLEKRFRDEYEAVKTRVNEVAWDGDWYLRGFGKTGRPIGSKTNNEGRIFLNPQSWAVLADIASEERRAKLWSAVDHHLETPLGMRVLHPAYTRFDPEVGSLSAALPGFYVNGIYHHAGAFKMAADCRAGRANAAWRTLEKLLPDSPENPSQLSHCEPFAMTNCYRGDDLRPGLSGDVWHTGTAPWIFSSILEGLIGLQREYAGLRITPCLPAAIKEARAQRLFRGCRYDLHIRRNATLPTGQRILRVEGQPVKDFRVAHQSGREQCTLDLEINETVIG